MCVPNRWLTGANAAKSLAHREFWNPRSNCGTDGVSLLGNREPGDNGFGMGRNPRTAAMQVRMKDEHRAQMDLNPESATVEVHSIGHWLR